MKKITNISYIITRVLAGIILFISQDLIVFAQQPTHYPDEHEPIPPSLINILIFIGGPILLFMIYYYYRKWEKKKAKVKEDRKGPSSTKATEGKEGKGKR